MVRAITAKFPNAVLPNLLSYVAARAHLTLPDIVRCPCYVVTWHKPLSRTARTSNTVSRSYTPPLRSPKSCVFSKLTRQPFSLTTKTPLTRCSSEDRQGVHVVNKTLLTASRMVVVTVAGPIHRRTLARATLSTTTTETAKAHVCVLDTVVATFVSPS